VNDPPTDRITVPPHMPLEDGKMVCRTCHTAHTVRTATDLSKVVFLRAVKEGGLCQQCHADRKYGAEHASHALAKLTFELPAELAAAGARMDAADRSQMVCQTCHTTHGARQDHLLVMGTSSGQLCVTCHEKLRPDEWRPDAPREHPENAPLKTAAQLQAIADMGTRLGPRDTLTCFSCHKMHSAKTGKYMLADTPEESRLCLRCHEGQRAVLNSPHDLRRDKPQEQNRLGQTAEQSGPCGACHGVHRYARDRRPERGDPSGRCAACHPSRGERGGKGLAFAHPTTVPADKVPGTATLTLVRTGNPAEQSFTCNVCHDPHGGGRFLRAPADTLCGSCHPKTAAALAGKHDLTDRPELKNGRGKNAAEVGKCGFCHAVHAPDAHVMWASTSRTPAGPDELCTACHREGGLAARTPARAYGHPTGPNVRPTTRATGVLPLFNEKGTIAAEGFVTCGSCHDPHADSGKNQGMLRVERPVSKLCVQCHTDNAAMAGGPHDARGKQAFPVGVPADDLCTSCHRPHGDDSARQRFTFVPAPGLPRADGACVACHGAQAWSADDASKPGRAIHPTTLPSRHAAATAGLPLLPGGDGKEKWIGCGTCHDPHAKAATTGLTRVASGAAASSLCIRCHASAEPLARSLHAVDAFERELSARAPACSPCHAVHAVEGSRKPLLWAAKASSSELSDPDQRCLTCHSPAAGRRRIVVRHPANTVATLPWTTDRAGAPLAADIRCATCHLTHGEPSAPVEPDLNARRAGRPMLRAGMSRRCAYCHGPSAAQLLLYWHDPAKRSRVPPPSP
jgi:predicted CXXCH cytochrome family protein